MKHSASYFLLAAIVISLDQSAHAVSTFGAKTRGSDLFVGTFLDGGVGSASASISHPLFNADANFVAGSTYLPELTAFSTNPVKNNSDDLTSAVAEAFQVFSSPVGQTVDLNVNLHGIVNDGSSEDSYVLADIYVYGGSGFEVFGSSACSDDSFRSRFLFDGTYFCGTRLERSNLFIPVGDVTLTDLLSFDVAPGELFGVYGILRAVSAGGSANATQTLSLNFTDDEFINVVNTPSAIPIPAAVWLFGAGIIGIFGIANRRRIGA